MTIFRVKPSACVAANGHFAQSKKRDRKGIIHEAN